MSRATELEAMGNALAAHSMMKPVDLAQFLGLSAPTVKLLLDAGTIPSVGEGKCRRIDPIRGAPAPLIAQYATLALAGLQIDEMMKLPPAHKGVGHDLHYFPTDLDAAVARLEVTL